MEEKRVVFEVVEVARSLEARDEHPEEGEGEPDRGPEQDRPPDRPREHAPARAAGRHHAISVRCAVRSIRQATSTSTGRRKIEMAAPSARSLPRMPVKKAIEGSTWVVSYGPPRVRM